MENDTTSIVPLGHSPTPLIKYYLHKIQYDMIPNIYNALKN